MHNNRYAICRARDFCLQLTLFKRPERRLNNIISMRRSFGGALPNDIYSFSRIAFSLPHQNHWSRKSNQFFWLMCDPLNCSHLCKSVNWFPSFFVFLDFLIEEKLPKNVTRCHLFAIYTFLPFTIRKLKMGNCNLYAVSIQQFSRSLAIYVHRFIKKHVYSAKSSIGAIFFFFIFAML